MFLFINQKYFLCFFILLLTFITGFAQDNSYPLIHTPKNIIVNTTLSKNILAPDEVLSVKFSKNPTDEEIFRAHFFEEPLVPADRPSSSEEDIALVYALAAFSQRTKPDDFKQISKFLVGYPTSRWKGSLLANMGIIYRRSGYYNMAMNAWHQSWNLMKGENNPRLKVLADRVVSELMLLNAWVGRTEEIGLLLKEMESRVAEGPAVERIASIKEAFWMMRNKPGISFKCGPYALNKIFTINDSTKAVYERLMEVQSGTRGFSLNELKRMSDDAGFHYQMAFRNPGAEVITKAVVHWKLGHYSALIKKENGYYKCEDATMGTVYGQQFWLSAEAMDSSASGYFLVPVGALPSGWRHVTDAEGSKIFGKGQEPAAKGKHVSNCDLQLPGCNRRTPMAQSNVHAAAVSLHIFDQPVFYTPPKGPAVLCNIDYHQREVYQPANFTYSNFGPKWTFEYISFIQDDPNNPSANADVYLMGGGVKTFATFDTVSKSYAPELQSNDVLVRVCPTCYELRHPDGSKEVYARPDGSTVNGRRIFLTQVVDVSGNALKVMYDGNLRIASLQDALGQVTSIKYENSNDIYKITKIIDPFGRSATFQYDGSGRLIKLTDIIGIVSNFQYSAADFINKMTTPYGTTKFIKEEGPGDFRALETNYPLGEKERVEFAENVDGISSSEKLVPLSPPMKVSNQYLDYRNTFFWDKKAMQELPLDYTKARIYHWLHGSSTINENGAVTPLLESMKEPLENRVWYNYQGQVSPTYPTKGMSARPSIIGRVLDDSTSQFQQFTYNSLGAVTSSIDPSGRKLSYVYDSNKIDLLEVRQTTNGANELLAKFTYNSKHLPLTAKDASGQITKYTYNTAGQVTTITNPRKEKITLTYTASGYLKAITGPVSGYTINLTYDGFGRLRTMTDQEGYTITTDYDALDRPTLITYPDGTYEQTVYDRLDAVHRRDRLGRWSHIAYDSLDRPSVLQDALGRITQLIWCSCGSLGEIVDPLKQITTFQRDLQGRLIRKTYHDGQTISYKYENTTSRLKEVTDAKGQVTKYSYYIDDNIKQLDYNNAVINTPSVFFSYDASYNRLDTMMDGTGITAYNYKPVTSGSSLGAGRLSSVDGPLANDVISYTYDSLGRLKTRSINNVVSSFAFDALGRITQAANALGNFGYKYVGQTARLSSVDYPNGQITVFDYLDNMNDQRLKQIWNKTFTGTTLSKFDYEYNKENQITKWTQQTGTATPKYFDLLYDLADQLTAATQKSQSTGAILKQYAYQYDKAGNRKSEQRDNSITASIHNTINQLTSQQSGGPMLFKGTVNEFSSVIVKNQSLSDSVNAPVDSATNTFQAFLKVVPGNNNISISATDYSGNNNKSTNNYTVLVGNGTNNTFSYDANGNLITVLNPAISYEWDAADRLIKITKGTNLTEFVYDGFSRRVAEKLNGTIIKRWLWDGTELCEERNVGGTVTKRFFPQGEQINGTNYYFTTDHLGSIREMTDGSGVIKARYDYDPYGRRTKITGNMDADFGFTGHFFHSESGLNLTLFRAYDASLGSWLNRDPIGELGGINLYTYANHNPINKVDLLGLDCSYNDPTVVPVSVLTVAAAPIIRIKALGFNAMLGRFPIQMIAGLGAEYVVASAVGVLGAFSIGWNLGRAADEKWNLSDRFANWMYYDDNPQYKPVLLENIFNIRRKYLKKDKHDQPKCQKKENL